MLRGAGAHEHVPRAQALARRVRQARAAARAAVGHVAPECGEGDLARRRLALRAVAAHVHGDYVLG